MKTKPIGSPLFYLFFVLILFSGFLISGCAPATPQTVEVTRIVNQTQVVTQMVTQMATQMVTVIVTATPVPPTATPLATPTSVYVKWKVSQVIDVLKKAGLEVEKTSIMTKDDYGLAPMSATEGIRFLVPSLCSDCGGRLFSFATTDDLKLTQDYYLKLGKSSAAFFSWVFVKDNILIQINGTLPEATARKYEAALNNMK
jgi:hypothetical protein